MNLTLETMALVKYGTIDAFAKATGRSKKSAQRLLDPAAKLKIEEYHLLRKLLEIPAELSDPLFFSAEYETEETGIAEILWIIRQRPELIEPLMTYIKQLQAEQEDAAR